MALLPTEYKWILSTSGLISSVNINHAKDTVNAHKPNSFRYGLSWFSKTSGSQKKESPLWD